MLAGGTVHSSLAAAYNRSTQQHCHPAAVHAAEPEPSTQLEPTAALPCIRPQAANGERRQ